MLGLSPRYIICQEKRHRERVKDTVFFLSLTDNCPIAQVTDRIRFYIMHLLFETHMSNGDNHTHARAPHGSERGYSASLFICSNERHAKWIDARFTGDILSYDWRVRARSQSIELSNTHRSEKGIQGDRCKRQIMVRAARECLSPLIDSFNDTLQILKNELSPLLIVWNEREKKKISSKCKYSHCLKVG